MAIDIKNVLQTNKANATAAAYLEAGKLANNQLLKLIKPKMPMVTRGYVDSPVGKLILANMLNVAVTQFKPDQKQAVQLTEAMICQAYQEALSSFDVEGILDEFFESSALSKSFSKLAAATKTADE